MIKIKCAFSIILLCCFLSALAQNGNKCVDDGIENTVDIRLSDSFVEVVNGNINGPLALECVVQLTVPGTVTDNPVNVVSYVWTRNGEILSGYTEEMLQIPRLESSDGGQYGCSAVTDFPCTTVQSDMTQVTTAPTVTLEPSSDITATERDRVEIVCQAEGWPVPEITWWRISTSGTASEITMNPALVFDSIMMRDSGQYSCVADNGVTDEVAVSRQAITITVVTETAPLPTDPTTTTERRSSSPSDGIVNNNLGPPVLGPTENGFYIGIAVSAFVCLLITVITILAVLVWCVRKRRAEREAAAQMEDYSEKDIDMLTVETMY